MTLPAAPTLPPTLRVIDGGSPTMRRDEAKVEQIVGIDDAIAGAGIAYAIVLGLAVDHDDGSRPTDLRWRRALEAIGQIAERAGRARAEVLALGGPDGSAA